MKSGFNFLSHHTLNRKYQCQIFKCMVLNLFPIGLQKWKTLKVQLGTLDMTCNHYQVSSSLTRTFWREQTYTLTVKLKRDS